MPASTPDGVYRGDRYIRSKPAPSDPLDSKVCLRLSEADLRGTANLETTVREMLVMLNPSNKVTPKQTISQYCVQADLTDVVIMFAATGARISEVLGIRWADIDLTAKTVTIAGKVNRIPGGGMIRDDFTKTKSDRTLPLPDFAINMLMARRVAAVSNIYDAVFPGQTGMLRDPSAVSKQWRRIRTKLKLDWVTSHTFRKTVATLIDAQGLSARIGADQLGHAQISMTQDKYMGRKVIQRLQTCWMESSGNYHHLRRDSDLSAANPSGCPTM